MNYKRMLWEAVKSDGIQFCLDALQEECAELIQAISHLRRGRDTMDNVITEMADVVLMCDMVRAGIEGETGFQDKIALKAEKIGSIIKFKEGRNDGQ